MAQQQPRTGPVAVPPPTSEHTPQYSTNPDNLIADFLEHYKELAASCGLTDQQMIETAHNWAEFRWLLEKLYSGTSANGQYTKNKLYEFVKDKSQKCKTDESKVIAYFCEFTVLSRPLVNSGRHTIQDWDWAFWYGFHADDRRRMEGCLTAKFPNQSEEEAFDHEDVYEITICLPNGEKVSNKGKGQGIQYTIDNWIKARTLVAANPPPAQMDFTRDTPPHVALSFKAHGSTSSQIEEVTDSYMLQITDTNTSKSANNSDSDSDNNFPNIFKVFTNKKKKHCKPLKLPEAEPPKQDKPPLPQLLPVEPTKLAPQY
ncbi:hypothetical protein F5148DRAFT_1290400 [Russula earlei]|uniref:Uncharacterized protein n=1 Tax=Russula earlei TaxID=71964 RepID=A0ACC0TVQ3_9AGAM|nr:hypothetical protein F5148DRAFT_1290400 [Russula earlei]